MMLTVLGSNSAVPTINSFQSAQLLELSGENFLIDCGEGTQMRLKQFSSKKINKINHIFISHAHFDHFLGLPGLLNSMVLQFNRTKPIYIYAPGEVFMSLENLLSILKDHSDFEINMVEIDTGKSSVIYDNKKVAITALPLIHGKPTCGFLFEKICNIHKIKRFAYCSDTAYNENLIPLLKDVETLYHESTYSEKETAKAVKYRHSTAKQAAIFARKVNAQQLLIGHFAGKYANPAPLLKEAKSVFENTVAVYDGFIINTI